MPTKWLRVLMDDNHISSRVELLFLVDEAWLLGNVEGSLANNTAFVRLNATAANLQAWAAATSDGILPFLTMFGKKIQFITSQFVANPARGHITVSGFGLIHKLPDVGNIGYECKLLTGALTVWTRDGFRSQSQFFGWADVIPSGSSAPIEFERWRTQIWPDSSAQVAALQFGKQVVQIEVKSASDRKRLMLLAERADERVWQLSDCGARDGLRTPRQVIDDLQARIDTALKQGGWQQSTTNRINMIATAPRRAFGNQAAPAVYYLASRRTGGAIDEYLGPDFDIEFRNDDNSTRWSPRIAKSTGNRIDLHDADYITALLNNDSIAPDPEPDVHLVWQSSNAANPVPQLTVGQIPPATCVGVSAGKLQGNSVWQYANTNVAPTSYPVTPVLVRYQVASDTRPVELVDRPSVIDGDIPISHAVLPDQWQFTVAPQLNENRPLYAKSLELQILNDSTHRVELAVFTASVEVQSPAILRWTPALNDPTAPPNAKLLASLEQGGDPLEAASLVFSSGVQTRQSLEFSVPAMAAGADFPAATVLSADDPICLIAAYITPAGSADHLDATHTSNWQLTDGAAVLANRTFGADFPPGNVRASLGALSNRTLSAGDQLTLAVTNGSTVNLPSIVLTIEYVALDKLNVQLECAAPKLSVHALDGDSVQAFWPHAPTALVDPIPAAARNLQQTRDLATLRTIVERDVSHGVSAWSLSIFRLRPDDRLHASATSTAPMAMLDELVLADLRPEKAQWHSAMALLPWVACRDQLAGARQQQLHHRNLVLESGEFAAASQDRTIDGRPTAFANTERDFIEAVRDPFTLAVNSLPTNSQPAEIINWLPGAWLNNIPKASINRPGIVSNLANRFPTANLQDQLNSGQMLKVLYRDGSGTPQSEPVDWLSYSIRRNGWNSGITPPKPNVEMALLAPARNRWREARNSAIPLLFDHASITGAQAADLPLLGSAAAATWICFGDELGRTIVADLNRPSTPIFLNRGTRAAANAVRTIALQQTSDHRWVIAVDSQGVVSAWNTTGELSALESVSTSINVGPAQFASACQLGDSLAILVCNPATSVAKLVVWNPELPASASNPVVIDPLPQINAADVVDICLVLHGSDVAIAVAHGAHPAVVLKSQGAGTSMQFTPVAMATPVTARLISCTAVEDGFTRTVAATVDGDANCRIWREDDNNILQSVDSLQPAKRVVSAQIDAYFLAPWLRPTKLDHPRSMIYLMTVDGAILGWETLPTTTPIALQPNRPPDREFGEVDRLATILFSAQLSVLAVGQRDPVVLRPHLLAFGDDGVCRIWDVDAEQLRCSFSSCEDVYDNLGAIHTVRPGDTPTPTVYVESMNRPGSASTERAAAESNYSDFDSIVDFSFFGESRGPIIESLDDPEAATQIFLVCDRLRLQKNGSDWIPETLADDLDPGPDRPRTPFPLHRGFVGKYGMYSWMVGENEELNYFPRLSGLPIYPTAIRSFRFPQSNGKTDFGTLEALEFDAAILNPLDVASGNESFGAEVFQVSDLPAGGSLAATPIFTTAGEFLITAISLTPSGDAVGVDASNGSVWTVSKESETIATATFGALPFPVNGQRMSLGDVSDPHLAAGDQLNLTIANTGSCDLPAVVLTIEYQILDDYRPRVPAFVSTAIQSQSVVRVRLHRDAGSGAIGVAQVSPVAANGFVWHLPQALQEEAASLNRLDGRLATLAGQIGYELFNLPLAAGNKTTGRLVLRLDPKLCLAELLAGTSALDPAALPGQTIMLVGFGRRAGRDGRLTFGFETPRLEVVTPSPGMLPLDLTRTTDHIVFTPGVRALAVDELADSRSLVAANDDSTLTWWDLATLKARSQTTLPDMPSDVAAAKVDTPAVLIGYGTRIDFNDAELGGPWPPDVARGAADARQDWSEGLPISALASAAGATFVGNAQGRVLCWDATGNRRFAVDLFSGPVIRLVAAVDLALQTPIVAAVDSTQSTLALLDGVSGETIVQASAADLFRADSLGAPEELNIRCVDLRRVDDDLLLAVVCRSSNQSIARWWKVNRRPSWVLTSIGATQKSATGPESAIVGSDGNEPALFYVANQQLLGLTSSGDPGHPKLIGSLNGGSASIDFGHDNADQYLAAASPGTAIQIWKQPVSGGGWTAQSFTAVPDDQGVRLTVSLQPLADTWTVTTAPGENLGDPIGQTSRSVQTFRIADGVVVFAQDISEDQVRQSGLLGPRIAVTPFPLPHAAVCHSSGTEVSLVALPFAQVRAALEHGVAVRNVRCGRNGNASILLTSTGTQIRAWDLATRQVRFQFDNQTEIHALEVSGQFAAAASNLIRVWNIGFAPDDSAHSVQFGDAVWPASRLAIWRTDSELTVVAATQSTQDQSRRIEVWDVSSSLRTARLRQFWPVHQVVSDIAVLDASTIAVSVQINGQNGVVQIVDLPTDVARNPVVRWRRTLTATATVRLTTLAAASDRQLVFDDQHSIAAWNLAPLLQITSSGQITNCLPVEIQDSAIADVGTFTADLLPGGGAAVHLTTAASQEFPERLTLGSVFRGTFGFIGRPIEAGSSAGQLGVCLWRNIQGHVAGSLIEESVLTQSVSLMAIEASNHRVPIAGSGDFVRQQFIAFNPDAAASGSSGSAIPARRSLTLSGRISATITNGHFALHLGEQQWDDTQSPAEVFAHLVWQSGNFMLQGPVRIQIAMNDEYQLADTVDANGHHFDCVYRVQGLTNSSLLGGDEDIQLPLSNGQLTALDLLGRTADESLDPIYATLRLTPAGVVVQKVSDVDIPFDTCLDADTAGSLPSATAEVVQLAHRQVLGARLRHQQLPAGSKLLAGDSSTVWTPSSASDWLVSPVIKNGSSYRILSQLVTVTEVEANTALQTENLILVLRDDTDSDDLGALTGLENLTSATDNNRSLLNNADISQHLPAVQAPGAVFHRILRGGQHATYQLVALSNLSSGATGGDSGVRATAVDTPVPDFRLLTPREAAGARIQFQYKYLLVEPPTDSPKFSTRAPSSLPPSLDLEIDKSVPPTRRYAVNDIRWSDQPARSEVPGEFGYLLNERTAFHQLPPPAQPPQPEEVFPGQVASKSFRPRSFELESASDKPGAMMHHSIQAIEWQTAESNGRPGMPKPKALVIEPAIEFALREPMQLSPPPGADLEILAVSVDSLKHRQAGRISLQWKETLGTIDVNQQLATSVPLKQTDFSGTPPDIGDVAVEFSADFVQMMVRINEELLEIDERQPQFPVYDARQSASSQAELGDKSKAFNDGGGTDGRPPAVEFGAAVERLSTQNSSDGVWALAIGTSSNQDKLVVYRLGSQEKIEPVVSQPTVIAEFAHWKGGQRLLCNDDSANAGVFLRDIFGGQDQSKQLSTDVYDELKFIEFTVVKRTTGSDGTDQFEPLTIEAYVGLRTDEIHIWYQRSDEADVQDLTIFLPTGSIQGGQVAVTSVLAPPADNPELPHHELAIAVGTGIGSLQNSIAVYQVDLLTATSPARIASVAVDALTTFAVAAATNPATKIKDQIALFAGDASGVVQYLDPATGTQLKQYLHSQPIEQIAGDDAAGTPVIIVATQESNAANRLVVWDVNSQTVLRTTSAADADYGIVNPIQLAGGLHLVAAKTASPGSIQIFDLLLTPYRPPELFLVSKVANLLHDFDKTIQYSDAGGPHQATVTFTPTLVMTDRNDRSIEYLSKLNDILVLDPNSGATFKIWSLKDDVPSSPSVDLRWERAGDLRIAWRGALTGRDRPLEAILFAPTGDKQIKPVPYSEVTPKIAAVALIDGTLNNAPVELAQKTAFFGDAATAGKGQAALTPGELKLAYQAFDQETVDVPLPSSAASPKLSLMLIKYLVDGQAIGTAKQP